MLKAIVTRQNKDGTYDEVGMNNRIIVKGKSNSSIRKEAEKYKNGSLCRVELFYDSKFYKDPFHRFYV